MKLFDLHSLRTKFTVIILLGLLAVLAVSFVMISLQFQGLMKDNFNSKTEEEVQFAAENFTLRFNHAITLLRYAAESEDVNQGLALSPEWSLTQEHINLEMTLEKLRLMHSYFYELLLVNSDGNVLAGNNGLRTQAFSLKDEPWFAEAITHDVPMVHPPFYDAHIDAYLVPLTLRLEWQGKTGLVVVTLQLRELLENAIVQTRTDNSSYLLVNAKGTAILGFQSDIIGDTIFESDELAQMQRSFSGYSENRYLDKAVAYSQIPAIDTYLVMIADYNVDTTHSELLSIFFITLACLVIYNCSLFFYLFSPLFKDIRAITNYSKKITKGDLDTIGTLKLNRKDEIANLARHINKMSISLLQLSKKANEVNELKSIFLAKMSHEIRTPLNGIIGMTKLALMDNPTKQRSYYLDRIEFASNNLLAIINDILDFSKIEAGKLTLNYDNVELRKIIMPIKDIFQHKLVEKSLDFQIIIDEDIPPYLAVDPIRLGQVCINLCNNAIKFTTHGYVHMRISLEKRSKGEVVLLVSVEDTGMGIPPEFHAQLFDSFAQVDSSYTRKAEGTGLGLTICKSLVNLMGGSIWFESKLGKGSTFYFTVQARIAKAPKEDTLPKESKKLVCTADENSLKPLRLLLVEDNQINQEIAMALFRKFGMTVTLATNGQEAVDLWNPDDFDVIFMDIQMPIMDGYTATTHIRSMPGGERVPIIAMTANASAEDYDKSFAMGMSHHITKPISVEEIHQLLLLYSNNGVLTL